MGKVICTSSPSCKSTQNSSGVASWVPMTLPIVSPYSIARNAFSIPRRINKGSPSLWRN